MCNSLKTSCERQSTAVLGLRNGLQPLGVGTDDVADIAGYKASEMKPMTIPHCKFAIDHWA